MKGSFDGWLRRGAAAMIVTQIGTGAMIVRPAVARADSITQTQEVGAFTTTPAAALTINLTTTAGDLLVVTAAVSGATFDKTGPILDSAGNGYQMIEEQTSGILTTAMFYTTGGAAITSLTVNATATATMASSIQEFTGADTLDAIVGAGGVSTNPDTGPSGSTTEPNEIVVAGIGFEGPGTLTAYRYGFYINSAYVSYPTPTPVAVQTASGAASAVGSQEYSATFSQPNSWGAVAATFYVSTDAAASSSSQGAVLSAGQQLRPGQYLSDGSSRYSATDFELIMQTDGNLVLYAPAPGTNGYQPPGGGPKVGRPLWASNTCCYSSTAVTNTFYAILQSDGNFVLYGNPCFPSACSGSQALWSSGTWGNSDYLVVQSDGNLVIYCNSGGGRQCSRGSQAIWSTATWWGTDSPAWTAVGNGSCWTGPYLCRNTWSGRSTNIYFRAVDQFSSARPKYVNGVQAAVNSWNSAPGPQYYSFTPHSNDTWIYIQVANLSPDVYGVTFNYRTDGSRCGCDNGGAIKWSVIQLSESSLDNNLGAVQEGAAHESGHAMLLGHNPDSNGALMWPVGNSVNVPTARDLGRSYACRNGGYGIFCIYGWGA